EHDRGRLPGGEEPPALGPEVREPCRQRIATAEDDRAARDVVVRLTALLHHAPAGHAASRIDAEHPHPTSTPPRMGLTPRDAPAPRSRCPCWRTRSARRP